MRIVTIIPKLFQSLSVMFAMYHKMFVANKTENQHESIQVTHHTQISYKNARSHTPNH